MNETLKTIQTRTSTRSYLDTPIPHDDLMAILNAGIQAPSALNRQCCEAYAIVDMSLIDELTKRIKDVYASRGEAKPEAYHFSYHAPVLVIVAGNKEETRLVEDGSCMLENIFLAATSLNIGSCWINQLRDTQDEPVVRDFLKSLGIPENNRIVGCGALGYIKNPTPIKHKNEQRIHIISEKSEKI